MLIMSPETDAGSTGGMATLTAAVAHLQTIHQTIDAVDAKAMFYVGLNFVALGIFVGSLDPLGWPIWASVSPGALTLCVTLVGAWALWPRNIAQFPEPVAMARFEGSGYSDDQLAWAYVESIERAVAEASRISTLKVWATYALFGLTATHAVAIFATALAFTA